MNALLSSLCRRPLEMLHHIRQIDFRTIDSCDFHCLVEQFAGRADKGMASAIFLIPGLLTNEYDLWLCGTFSEDGLRRVPPQITSLTIASRGTEPGKCSN
jgi:hypothetical protein